MVAERLSGSRLVSVVVVVDRRTGEPQERRLSVYVEPGRACMTFASGDGVVLKDVGHHELRAQLVGGDRLALVTDRRPLRSTPRRTDSLIYAVRPTPGARAC